MDVQTAAVAIQRIVNEENVPLIRFSMYNPPLSSENGFPVAWMALDADEARRIAAALIEGANDLDDGKGLN